MAKSRKEPKLPVQQLLILSICRFAEPVALSSVFPYLPEMIESFNVPRNEVAKWAGILSAMFSLSQSITGIAIGRASDRYGRKPIIMLALFSTMTASVLFGFCRSLPLALAARALAGASSGNVGTIRTTVAEIVPQKILQPRAFSIMPLVWTIGSIFGPVLGGALAKPAERYPQVFGNSHFFREFPFALPNLVACIFFLVGLLMGILFLKASSPLKVNDKLPKLMGNRRHWKRSGTDEITGEKKKKSKLKHDEEQASLLKRSRLSTSTAGHGDEGEAFFKHIASSSPPSYREVFSPQSNINLLAYTLLALHSVAYDQLLPVFMHLPPQLNRSTSPEVSLPFKFAGGFGLRSGRIGLIFTMYGIFGMFVQFLVFPPVARRYGVLNCLKGCTLVFPIAYLLTPFAVLFPTPITQQVAIFCVMLVKCCAGVFAFPCVTILLTNSARNLRLLGTLNGFATSFSAIGRAAGPSISGTTLTLGVDIGDGWFGGAEDSSSEDERGEEEDLLALSDNGDDDAGLSSINLADANDSVGVNGSNHSQGEDDFAIEEDDFVDEVASTEAETETRNLGRGTDLHSEATLLSKRTSSPLGMRESIGPGGGRRLSNGIGQSMNEFGAGASPYQ
ncbi:hypothetical protein MMC30_003083 [Trapelia coarctata]|nr:hypothetical protein [Trapelia coarctata]